MYLDLSILRGPFLLFTSTLLFSPGQNQQPIFLREVAIQKKHVPGLFHHMIRFRPLVTNSILFD